ncbi:hypothetical protein BgiBS90_016234 [Biomphalaria glabrata]|nr:hypothetical protein BgiBS90_016234 [Biomphalaria glabrata]
MDIMFALVISCIVPLILCFNKSLDEHCIAQMPAVQDKTLGRIGYKPLIVICSNIDKFSNCIMENRTQKLWGVQIEPFEKQFPGTFDLFRAGYMFCSETFPKNAWKVKSITEEDTLHCEQNVDVEKCRTESLAGPLKELLRTQVPFEIFELSCIASYKFYKCLREQYTRCNADMDFFFIYHFARLGVECIYPQNEFNPVLMEEVCTGSSKSQGFAQGFSHQPNSRAMFTTLLLIAVYFLEKLR